MDTATELKASDTKCIKTFFGGGSAVVAGGGLQPLDAWTKMCWLFVEVSSYSFFWLALLGFSILRPCTVANVLADRQKP